MKYMAREDTTDPQERFLEFFKMEKYRQKIAQMALQGKESFTVDFTELFAFDQKLAETLLDKPDTYLEHANNAAHSQLGIEDKEYAEKMEKITVRIAQLLGREQLRKLGSKQMGKLVMIDAIIVRATPVRPMVMIAAFKCKRCGTVTKTEQTGQFLKAPTVCTSPDCGKDGPFEFLQDESTFIDSQDLRLQERPEDLPPGQLPRTLAVKLIGSEVVDMARPGDHVSIVGIVHAFAPSRPGIGKLRTFILQLDANSIEVMGKEPETTVITKEEEEKILTLSKDPNIYKKLVSSVAPSIYGYNHIKEAILYQLCGGASKILPDVNVRGELNVLLIGDPGTAKSQLLQYVARVAPRGLYTSGRGTTAAGLTAAVIREKGGSMSLEAGALVLADKGIACLHPQSEVIVEGKTIEIGKLASGLRFTALLANEEIDEVASLNVNTVSLKENLQVTNAPATKLRRRWFKGHLLKIRFKSGSVTRVTPDHQFLDGKTQSWKAAKGFKVEDNIVGLSKAHELLRPDQVLDSSETLSTGEGLLLLQIQKPTTLQEIVEINAEPYEGYVYDFMMQKLHNYYSDGVISHNCIDEMDKMRPEDRVAIHEAMEQHTVSVAKGGIVATLNARTAVLAAANPTLGRYEPNLAVANNISLPVTILSRFDIIFVLRDIPNKEADGKMSQHILEIHQRGISPVEAPVDAEMLRKYISYSKTIRPELTNDALNKLRDFYLAMRSASETEGSPVAITARQLESLVRVSEARARSALRKDVTGEDADAAITLMKKSLEEVGIDMSSYKADIDLIMTGRPKSVRDKLQIVLSAVVDMEKETGSVNKDVLTAALEETHKLSRSEIERMIGQLLREGTLYEPGEGKLKKT